ncbi:hypothetical protein FA15DRAFT_588787 [Coprinopsis marcescibilis]|uniref:N-acetyltransferase domain-containing protein n=1 Tax=Coprinopsis marcescibilis TaxID=230819 RepID=A0A5C3L0L5_COPMA|nr:hypothetical protein FA15DRAFT_588787 [Coprinopsis marcescibilis]
MPVATKISGPSQLTFECFTSASQVPEVVIAGLHACGPKANIILPLLLKCRSGQQNDSENTWFVVYSNQDRTQVLYVASCTASGVAEYPLFIVTTMSYESLVADVVEWDMEFFCKELLSCAQRERVYSVFAVDRVATAFTKEWVKLTGIEAYRKPYYDCTMSFCSAKDLKPRRQKTILDANNLQSEIGLGNKNDIPAIADLCELFAEESVKQEATLLQEQGAVWVHRIRKADSPHWEIASIAACSRNTADIATITKVYTNPKWRRLGCAERLTRDVCKQLFNSGKSQVALFVGNSNPASIVYDRVGFRGLQERSQRIEGVDRYLEIGFDRRVVCSGHW